jgi:uncharacterized Zn-binding protein involved in type VI secretion
MAPPWFPADIPCVLCIPTSGTALINGRPAARIGDITDHVGGMEEIIGSG